MDRAERLNDPEEALRLAIDGALARLWTAAPGIVQAVDLVAQTCSVQPTIQGEIAGPDGETQTVNLPLLVDVPLVFPRAGGFAVTFPVAAGDEVLVVFGARCIDAWYQSGGVQPAAEARMHDLSDGFAIPGPTSQPRKLAAVSTVNMQMRTEGGEAFIEMTPAGGVRIVCSSYAVESSGAASIEAATSATMTGAASATVSSAGAASIAGATLGLTSPGAANITAGSLLHNGVNMGDSHTHPGVVAGGDNTGGPQ